WGAKARESIGSRRDRQSPAGVLRHRWEGLKFMSMYWVIVIIGVILLFGLEKLSKIASAVEQSNRHLGQMRALMEAMEQRAALMASEKLSAQIPTVEFDEEEHFSA